MLADAKRLLPFLASDSASAEISGHIFNGLTKYDKDIRLVGDIAESWSISPDGLTITFYLKKGVKFHDAVELTSEDVVFTYETVINPKTPTPYATIFGPVLSVKALDRYTLQVIYKEPYVKALEAWSMGIIPKHIYKDKDIASAEVNRHPIGAGPYKLKEWVTGQKIVLEAFEGYYEGPPGIKKIITRIIPDTATMFLELKFGGIDYMGLTPAQYKLQAQNEFFNKHFQKFRYLSFSYTYLGYNLLNPLFADKRVRQAIAHAVNKEDIIKGVLLGYGKPCLGPFHPETWAFNKNVKDFDYDVSKAKQLLAEAGWQLNADGILHKDGKPFVFTVITNQGNDLRLKTAQLIKEALKEVGIVMNIKVLEWQAMLHEFVDKKRFDAVILGWALSRDPEISEIWHSSKTKQGQFNFISYKNEEVDRLLMLGRKTVDISKRKQIYHRVHELIFDDQPYLFLYVPEALPVMHKRIKGVTQAPLGIWHNYTNWTIALD